MQGTGYFKPGDSKSIVIDVKNDSDVGATITATVDKTALDSVFGEEQIIYTETLTIDGKTSEDNVLAAGKSGQLTITCTWPYTGTNDAADTAIGAASAAGASRTTADIGIELTATQVAN